MPSPARHGYGHRTTPEHKARRFGAAHPVAAAAAFPPAAALRRFRSPQFDQRDTSTCFAHAQAVLAVVACAAAGAPLLFVPSPLEIARFTYCIEQTDATKALEDTGADMADVMTACAESGILPLGTLAAYPDGRPCYSDATPEALRVRPTLLEDERAAQELLLGAEQLQPAAADFAAQCATSIANLHCGLSVGIHSTPAFENYQPGAPAITDLTTGATDTDGHDVALLDYRTNPTTGELEFWLLSSWGPFGDEGGAWVSAGALQRGGCLEAWRMRLTVKAAA